MKTSEAIHQMHTRLDVIMGRGEVEAVIRMVMSELLNYSPVDIVLREQNDLPEFFNARLEDIISRLERHEPIQYILGVTLFHGHRLHVGPGVLIPRPETEQLVDLIVDEWGQMPDRRVLDIGTGSGCIAIALARALRFAQVRAIDVSTDALNQASANAQALKARVEFVRADIMEMRPAGELDIVVSNPPYVCWSEREQMEPNVIDYEPATALFIPDDDPLMFYRPIAEFASATLTHGGGAYLEVNRRYATQVAALLCERGLTDCNVLKDSYGNDRFVTARMP